MKKSTYFCDICHDEQPAEALIGLRFKNTKQFVFDVARSTDGTHICNGCMEQLRQQLAPKQPPHKYDAAAHSAAYP